MNEQKRNSMRIRFTTSLSNGGMLTFSAPVVAMRIKDRAPIVRIPSRVRSIPFPPFGGKCIVTLKPEMAARMID